MADRVLDVAPGELGDAQDRRDLEDGPERVGAPCASRGRGEDDDRQGPEVDPVGALADPAHRLAADDRAEPGGGMGERGDGEHGGRARAGRSRRGRGRARTRSCCQNISPITSRPDAPRRRRSSSAPGGRSAGRRRRLGQTIASAAPSEQLQGAGVGSVVDPRGVQRRAVEDRHQDARAERGDQGDAGEPQAHARRARHLGDEVDAQASAGRARRCRTAPRPRATRGG